jgi:Mn-containing catalase
MDRKTCLWRLAAGCSRRRNFARNIAPSVLFLPQIVGAGEQPCDRHFHRKRTISMFYVDKRLQFPVRVETPNPLFARALQQAIGGVEGEIRVAMQYFFQACGARGGDGRFRDMLMNTAAEELGHIEMLATAVALNLEGAPLQMQEEAAADPVAGAVLGGINLKNLLSTGLAAMPVDSDGVPFDMSHIYASGNLAADMMANAVAESTGRVLAVRLHNMTTDPGMREMLGFLIARDAMHQNQWLAAVEELGGIPANFPIPNSHPDEQQNTEFAYAYLGFQQDGSQPAQGRWSEGPSIDGKGEFTTRPMEPLGEEPQLAPARPGSGAQSEQIAE